MNLYLPSALGGVIPVVAPATAMANIHFAEETLIGDTLTEVPVQGKWIYVTHGAIGQRVIVAVINAVAPDEWIVENRHLGQSMTVHHGVLELVADLHYECFLSPYELDTQAQAELLHVTTSGWDNAWWVVPVYAVPGDNFCSKLCDPFERSLLIHQNTYLPALKKWQDFLYGDPDVAAQRFIACTLKVLTQGDDPLDLNDDLEEGALTRELETFEKIEARLRSFVEQAMVEVAMQVDSDGYRLIAAAARRNGENDLHSAFLQFCALTLGIGHTLPGRQLATHLVSQADQNMLSFLIGAPQESPALAFREYRYLANAGMAALANLMPSLVDRAGTLALAQSLALREDVVAKWATRLVRTGNVRVEPLVLRQAGLTGALLNKVKKNAQLVAFVLREEVGSSFNIGIDEIVPPHLVRAQRNLTALDNALKSLTIVAAGGLELCNTALAIANVCENGPSLSSIQGFVGASADLSAMVLGVLEKSLLSEAWLSRVKKLLPYAGFVAAICDFVDFAKAASAAHDNRDYPALVGNSIATLGAAGLALGTGMAIAVQFKFVLVAAATGQIVMVVGAALIATGVARPYLEIFYKIWWIATLWACFPFVGTFRENWRLDSARRLARKEGRPFDESPWIAIQERKDAEHEALVAGRSQWGKRRLYWAKVFLYSAPIYFVLTQASQALLEQYGEVRFVEWYNEGPLPSNGFRPPESCRFDAKLYEYTFAKAEKTLLEGLEKKRETLDFWSFLDGLPIPPITQGYDHVRFHLENRRRVGTLRFDESMSCKAVEEAIYVTPPGYYFAEAWRDTRLLYDIWGTCIFYAVWVFGQYGLYRYKTRQPGPTTP